MKTEPEQYSIRLATADEVSRMPDIERAAATVFEEYEPVTGLSRRALEHTNSVEAFAEAQRSGYLWVVADGDDRPVGFAMLRRLHASLHIQEIDVLPDHARRGLGARLLEHVCRFARLQGAPAVTLTTYRDVPWNAPFYARHGFRILEDGELSDDLLAIRDVEVAMGWRVSARVTMLRDLAR